MNTKSCVALLVVGMLSLANLKADDLQPPPWRGGPLSTVAEWDFLTPGAGPPDGTSIPTVAGNGGPAPLASPGTGINWIPFDGTGGWVGTNGGQMIFEIADWIDNEPYKLLWIQLTYQLGQAPPSVTGIQASDPLGITGIVFDGATDTPIQIGAAGLFQRVEQWRIFPNPDREVITVFIPADTVLTQAIIDTISIPEPSSVVLAMLGGALAAVAVWRRRRSVA